MITVDDLMALADRWAEAYHNHSEGSARVILRTALEAALVAEYERGRGERGDERRHYICMCPDCVSSKREQDAEPVAWLRWDQFAGISGQFKVCETKPCDGGFPVYDSPPKREPLNFDQLQSVMAAHFGAHELTDDEKDSAEAFARAIERAHGIGDE
jgi:hypothetical protein